LAGLFEIGRENCRVCVFSETLVKELAIVFSGCQGIIPVAYKNVFRRNMVHATLDGVAAAMLFGLDRVYQTVSKRRTKPLIFCRCNDNRLYIDVLERINYVPQHRMAKNIMENLGYRTLHASAESSG
jgi:hypothetical protein